MNKYAEYKEIYKGLIKEAILGIGYKEDSAVPEAVAAGLGGLGGAATGLQMAAGNKMPGLLGQFSRGASPKAKLLSALGMGALGAGAGALGTHLGSNIDNSILSYIASGVLGGGPGLLGNALERNVYDD